MICPASEPSIVLSNPIDDPAYFGDIPSDIQDGTLTADGITLPNTIDYTDLITDGSSVVDSVISLPGSIVDDDTYADALALLTLTYADTEVVPDTTTPVEPEETTPAVSLEGALSDVDVVAFVEFLVKSITAPLTIVADTITFTLKELFVPTEDFLTVKVDALRSEFAFADSIVSAGELVGSTLQSLETEPPVIYIDLSSARGSFAPGGKYPLGGKEVFIDMSWYAEYKPVGDALLSALLWIAFIWRMFIKLPGIISGMPGDFVMDGLHHIGLADRLPSRTASYEVQRISNRQSLRKGPGR